MSGTPPKCPKCSGTKVVELSRTVSEGSNMLTLKGAECRSIIYVYKCACGCAFTDTVKQPTPSRP